MANRRISDLPAITSIDINDADLFTIVHVAEVDPGLKNKKFTVQEHKAYLNNYYLQLTGGTVATLTVANNLNVSGNATVQNNLNVIGTGTFGGLTINNLISTGTISGTTITGQSIQGVNVNGNNGYFVDLQYINAVGDSIRSTAISGTTITGDVIRASGITGQTITGNTINAINVNATSITGVTGIFTTLLSGLTVTGNTLNVGTGNIGSGYFVYASGSTLTGVTGLFATQTVGTGNFTRISGTTITGTTGLFASTTTVSGQYTNISGNTITGNSLRVSTGVFNSITGSSYFAGGVIFASGAGDVRPFNQFSFPQTPGTSGYVLTTLGNGTTTWTVATTTGALITNQIAETKILIDVNYSIGLGYNGFSVGPVGIASGITVTVPSGSTWRVLE